MRLNFYWQVFTGRNLVSQGNLIGAFKVFVNFNNIIINVALL